MLRTQASTSSCQQPSRPPRTGCSDCPASAGYFVSMNLSARGSIFATASRNAWHSAGSDAHGNRSRGENSCREWQSGHSVTMSVRSPMYCGHVCRGRRWWGWPYQYTSKAHQTHLTSSRASTACHTSGGVTARLRGLPDLRTPRFRLPVCLSPNARPRAWNAAVFAGSALRGMVRFTLRPGCPSTRAHLLPSPRSSQADDPRRSSTAKAQ